MNIPLINPLPQQPDQIQAIPMPINFLVGENRAALLAAFERLRETCSKIDEDETLAGQGAASLEARILLKIRAYSEWLVTLNVRPPMRADGMMSNSQVLQAIRHAGAKRTSAIKAALHDLAETYDLNRYHIRHSPPREIDFKLDAYEIVLQNRGYGAPLSFSDPSRICKYGAAREIGCHPADLDRIAILRLQHIGRSLNQGHVNTVGVPMSSTGRRTLVSNPALPHLAKAGMSEFTEGVPEDPLFPGKLDFITIADACGMNVRDLLGSAVKPIVLNCAAGLPRIRNPFLDARRYTYADLIKWGRGEAGRQARGDAAAAGGQSVFALRRFMTLPSINALETDLVPLDLKSKIERAIVTDAKSSPHGWTGRMGKWIEFNDSLRSTKPLPRQFGLALRILCVEVGLEMTALGKACGGEKARLLVYNWASGLALPSLKQEATVKEMCRLLRVPREIFDDILPDEFRRRIFDTDVSRLSNATRRLPHNFDDLQPTDQKALIERIHRTIETQGTLPAAERRREVAQDKYRLPKDKWPPAMLAATNAAVEEQINKSPLRRLGEDAEDRKDPRNTPKKPKREGGDNARDNFLSTLFGYWTRPRKLAGIRADEQPRKSDFTPEAGLGIPVELLSPGLMVLNDLLISFSWWKFRRSGIFGAPILNILEYVSAFLKPKTGYVWSTPELIKDLRRFKQWWDVNPHDTMDGPITLDISAFEANWQEAVEAAWNMVMDDIAKFKRGLDNKIPFTRDPFAPVSIYVDHAKPMELYARSMRGLLQAKPIDMLARHLHARDCIQAQILVQTGLRTKNMVLTFDDGVNAAHRRLSEEGIPLPPTLRRVEDEGTVKWIVHIPSSEFKNYYSPYFADGSPYELELSNEDGLYERLEFYAFKSRPYMLKGRITDAFFVTREGTDFDEHSLGANYRRIVSNYFIFNPDAPNGGVVGAMVHGMHAVRSVIATHILKMTGDITLAAWAIQDQPETLRKHYARFIPKDKVKLAAKVLKRARRAAMA